MRPRGATTDFARWTRLPSALSPNGDWDGALSFVDGEPVIMFDCYNVPDCRPPAATAIQGGSVSATAPPARFGTGDPAIVGVAHPVDKNDPNLTKWTKDPANPIVVHGARGGFQGPSTLWKVGDTYNVLMAVSAVSVCAPFAAAPSSLSDWPLFCLSLCWSLHLPPRDFSSYKHMLVCGVGPWWLLFRLARGQGGTRPATPVSTSGISQTHLSTQQRQGRAFSCLYQMPVDHRAAD